MNEAKIRRFNTTINKKAGYQDKPFILSAAASTILNGVNLLPADVVVLIDGEWSPEKQIQVGSRVRRNRTIQAALRIETFRLIPVSDYCHLGTWLAARNADQTEV